MKRILEHISTCVENKIQHHPLIEWLRCKDDGYSAVEKLKAWIPIASYFSFGFKDLTNMIWKYPADEAKGDTLKTIINVHCIEDGNHWPWLLKDLVTLELNKDTDWVSMFKFLWSKENENQRQGLYDHIILSQRAKDPRLRFIMMWAFEKCGHILFTAVSNLGSEFETESGKKLYYCGKPHLDAEDGTVGGSSKNTNSQEDIWMETLTDEDYHDATEIVNEVLRIFNCRWSEALEYARQHVRQ